MSKRLIVLGNGFDISCGLKSKYDDYFKDCLHEDIELDKLIDYLYDSNEEPLTYADKAERRLKENINMNFWRLFFLSVYSRPDLVPGENWSDLEQLMRNFLLASAKETDHSTDVIDLIWTSYRLAYNEKIRSKADKNKLSFALGLFLRIKKPNLTDQDEMYDYLRQDLKEFEKEFGKYIKKITSNTKNYISEAERLMDFLTADVELKRIESFNYSNPFENGKYADKFKHLHGSVKNPIFGINFTEGDAEYYEERLGIDSPFNERATIESSELYKKPARKFDNSDPLPTDYEDVDEILIYGHSLNGQDTYYYENLFDIVDFKNLNNEKPKLIIASRKYDDKTIEEIKDGKLGDAKDMLTRYFGDNGSIAKELEKAERLVFMPVND